MTDLLVTGTDTEVGKTVISAALLLAAGAAGRPRLGFKPVETGLTRGQLADSDVLARADGLDEPLRLPLLRLAEPLTPALAAERAQHVLVPSDVLARVRALRDVGWPLVVEGAGGLLAPLAWNWTTLDLAAQAGLTVVLVARAGLGTLNHVLLSVEALRARHVTLRALVLNGQSQAPDLAEATNPQVLTRLLPEVPIVVVPRVQCDAALTAARQVAPLLAPLLNAD
jgi:dethiobiotin synthase